MGRAGERSKLASPLYCASALQAPLGPVNEYFTTRAKGQQLKRVTLERKQGRKEREREGGWVRGQKRCLSFSTVFMVSTWTASGEGARAAEWKTWWEGGLTHHVSTLI